MTAKAFTVAVAGASGYAGSEAARIIFGHPGLRLGALAAHSNAGQPVTALMPQLAGAPGLAATFTGLDRSRAPGRP